MNLSELDGEIYKVKAIALVREAMVYTQSAIEILEGPIRRERQNLWIKFSEVLSELEQIR